MSGSLSPGATEYYIGEVATSAEDYYSGRGETTGRWVGSLAAELGLSGPVDAEHFRRVLQGKHPLTGEHLVTAQGWAARAGRRRRADTHVKGALADRVDTLRAAAQLRVSDKYVRRLLQEGRRYRARVAVADEGELVGELAGSLALAQSDAPPQSSDSDTHQSWESPADATPQEYC